MHRCFQIAISFLNILFFVKYLINKLLYVLYIMNENFLSHQLLKWFEIIECVVKKFKTLSNFFYSKKIKEFSLQIFKDIDDDFETSIL